MSTAAEAPTRRTAPRDVRRKQLINAAIDSIAKRGFADTTLRHVTEKAKLSHGVVNYHFDSKEALYDATLGYLAEEHYDLWSKAQAAAGPAPADQLAAIISADFDKKVCSHKKIAVWFAFFGQAKYRPNYLKIHNKFDNRRSEEVARLCGLIIEEGGYDGLDADRMGRTVEALLDGEWLNLMLYPDEHAPEEGLKDCFAALARLFPRHFDGDGAL